MHLVTCRSQAKKRIQAGTPWQLPQQHRTKHKRQPQPLKAVDASQQSRDASEHACAFGRNRSCPAATAAAKGSSSSSSSSQKHTVSSDFGPPNFANSVWLSSSSSKNNSGKHQATVRAEVQFSMNGNSSSATTVEEAEAMAATGNGPVNCNCKGICYCCRLGWASTEVEALSDFLAVALHAFEGPSLALGCQCPCRTGGSLRGSPPAALVSAAQHACRPLRQAR